MATMKAAVYRQFGGPEVVHIEEVPRPAPKPDEVLIRIRATTVSIADHRMRAKDLPKGLGFFAVLVIGIFAPRKKVLGMDLAGVVEAVGPAVTRFRIGDEVIAMPGAGFGAHAQYICLAETAAVALKPKSLNFEEAAALVFGGLTALAFLNRITIKPGDEILVNGASGAVGSAAVQLAAHRGANVTAVTSGGNAEMVRALGASHVIDYRREDFAAGSKTYDAVVECVGNAPFERVDRVIKPGGALLLVIADLKALLFSGRMSRKSGKKVSAEDWKLRPEDMAELARLADAGAIRPVIDRYYDFADIVEAHRYVDTGRKKGNVVLRMP